MRGQGLPGRLGLEGLEWKRVPYGSPSRCAASGCLRDCLESARLEEPLFTPATKATTGHDENISFERMVDVVGQDTAERLRDLSLAIYCKARDYAASKGFIIADTKFEFGACQGEIILVDEVLTPDSFPVLAGFRLPALANPSSPSTSSSCGTTWKRSSGTRSPPAPKLPDWVVEATSRKYMDAFERLTGRKTGWLTAGSAPCRDPWSLPMKCVPCY